MKKNTTQTTLMVLLVVGVLLTLPTLGAWILVLPGLTLLLLGAYLATTLGHA